MINRQETRARHAKYYSRLAGDNRSKLDELASNRENIFQAAEFYSENNDWDALWLLAQAMNDYWYKRGQWDLYVRFNSMLVAEGRIADVGQRARLCVGLARMHELRGDYDEARELYSAILEIARINEPEIALKASRRSIDLARRQGDNAEAAKAFANALGVARGLESYSDIVDLSIEGVSLFRESGDLDRALGLCNQALEMSSSLGYWSANIDLHLARGTILASQQKYSDAAGSIRKAMEQARQLGDHARAKEARELLESMEMIQRQRIFISYNHNDRTFVARLANDLKASGLSVWWAEWEIKVGESIIRKVSEGIEQSAYLAVALSPNSVTSEWVKRELSSALMDQLSVERNITVLPLLLADCEIPVLLRDVKRADFRYTYEDGLQDLLRVFGTKRPSES